MYRLLIMMKTLPESFEQRLYRTMQIMQDTERVLNATINRKDLVSLKLRDRENEDKELYYRLSSMISFHNKNPESQLFDLFENTSIQKFMLDKIRAMDEEQYKKWLNENLFINEQHKK